MDINKIKKAINLASYDTKELLIETSILVELKNHIEFLEKTIDAKNRIIKNQQKQINDLTSKLIKQNIKRFEEYIWKR